MTRLPYDLEEPEGVRARLGLAVLQVDETIEADFRRMLPEGVALHVTRVPSGLDLIAETIGRMVHDLPGAVALLPGAAPYDAVGYACTSGTTLIGAERVAALVRSRCEARTVCDPLSAAIAAFRYLRVTRVGLVSPYVPEIAADVRRALERAGIFVQAAVSFGERVEANVARIAPRSVAAAARQVAAEEGVEAVFLSCTNLRTLETARPLTRDLGLPVLGSNIVLAWQMLGAAGVGAANPLDLVPRE